MLPTITINGRAVADSELRFTSSGKAVASFRVACSESKKQDDGSWEDGDRLFVGVSVWGDDAEAVAEKVLKGVPVVVTGRLFQREYEGRDGEKRTSLEIKFADVALPVKKPKGERVPRTDNGSSWERPAASTSNDPWGAPRGGGSDEPPF